MPRERVVVFEAGDERDIPVREPAAELAIWRGCGPERGEWEDARRADGVEYLPPRHGRAA